MYKIKNEDEWGIEFIQRLSDNALIPISENNADYQAYLAWVAEGNTAEEWTPEGIIE
jgi:hypothetical protein